MELKITKHEHAPLLSAQRVNGQLKFVGVTPSYIQVREEIAKSLKTKPELVEIQHIYNDYRAHTAEVIAIVYDNEAVLKKLGAQKKAKAGATPKKEEKDGE
jgi:ribosomal protein S24E